MPYIGRLLRAAVLFILLMGLVFPAVTYAQEEELPPVVIQGTPELEILVSAIQEAYIAANSDATPIEIDTSLGLRGSFEALCQGEADIIMSTEPISDAQIELCDSAEQTFIEAVLAYEIVVLLTPSEAAITCLDYAQVSEFWQLGAPGDVTWTDLGATELDTAVEFYGPENDTVAYTLFSALVPAGALRDDIITATVADIQEQVQAEESTAFGFMSQADLDRLDVADPLSPVVIRNTEFECVAPTLQNIAARTYPLARTDYLYVNADSAQQNDVREFLQFALTGEDGVQALTHETLYTLAETATYEAGINNVLNDKTGRTFTRPDSPVLVPPMEMGEVTVVGTTAMQALTEPIQQDFMMTIIGTTVQPDLLGNTVGWAAFCAGEADVLQSTRDATTEELALCEENGIEPYTVDLGYQALVLALTADNEWAECVNADQITTLLRAGTDEESAATLWNDVNSDWPESDILLMVPPRGTGETDYLIFTLLHDLTFATRMDGLENADPLYRAQGVANTDNGLTYFWWTDLQNSTAKIKLLEVDGGDACVAPELETVQDGTYPLAYPVRFHVSQASFDNPFVRAFLWHLYGERALDVLKDYPFAGLDLELMAGDQRDDLFNMLAAYEETVVAEAETPPTDDGGEDTEESTGE